MGSGEILGSGQESTALPTSEFRPKDTVTGLFVSMSLVWGIVAALFAAFTAFILVQPNLMSPEYTFARLRPVHFNLAIYAFAANSLFAAVYFSTQRLCKRAMWSSFLGYIHFLGWQIICAWILITSVMGHTQHRETAEFVWQIDLAMALVWCVFATNFALTILTRRVRHLYISLWFYVAALVAFLPIHVLGNLVLPSDGYASTSLYTGVMDGFVQSWHGASRLMYLVVMPFMGAMYYFVPRISGRPVAGYRLAITQFWFMAILGTFASSRGLHFTPVPEWLTSLGMLAGILMFMPSWVGVTNGLAMLRGPLRNVENRSVLSFFLVGIVFYAIASFEGAFRSIKSIGALAEFTDWSLAHSYAMIFGFAGFTAAGMIYWIVPKMCQAKLWNPSLMRAHLWVSVLASLLCIGGAYLSGYFQASMTHGLDSTGTLLYPEFVEIVQTVQPLWWARAVGAVLFALGFGLLLLNVIMTWVARDRKAAVPCEATVKPSREYQDPEPPSSALEGEAILQLGINLDIWSSLVWHRRWERSAFKFLFLVKLAIYGGIALLFVPMYFLADRLPPNVNAVPYTPLELLGREIFVAEGCASCHTQVARPMLAEGSRYGDFSLPTDFQFDRPAQWGSLRIGPDLSQEGGKQTSYWHWQHLADPQAVSEGSVMPRFDHLLEQPLEIARIRELLIAASELGVPYDEELLAEDDLSEEDRLAGDVTPLEAVVQKQAELLAADIVKSGGPAAKFDRQGVAIVAYLQRLGITPVATSE